MKLPPNQNDRANRLLAASRQMDLISEEAL